MRARMHKAGVTALTVAALITAAAFVFVASANAGNYGVGVLKDCTTPINVGDPYSCEVELDNTAQASHASVRVTSLQDVVLAAGGSQTQVYAINSSSFSLQGGLILTGGATCDATGCTVPFGGTLSTPFFSHYDATVADFPQLNDQATYTWNEICDTSQTPGCSETANHNQATASADINPLDTQTVTTIHDAGHNAVTSVPIGSTVHDFVSVTDVLPNEPAPQGNVTVDFFSNGSCSGEVPDETSAPTPLDPNGQADVTSFTQTLTAAGQVSFQAHYAGGANGAFNPSVGACEPLTVTPNTPSITTELSASSVDDGTAVHDTAKLTGATFDATGTVTYSVYADNECEIKVADGGTVAVADGLVPDSNALTLPAGSYFWQASYSGDANNDPATSGCTEEPLVVAPLVDLTVTKAGAPADQELTADSTITWTMVVTNNGPDTDTGVKIVDPMPAGNTFVSAQSSQGTCTGGPILNCTIGTMNAGAHVTITLVTKPTTVGQQVNTVTVSGDKPETNTTNNQATATVVTHQNTPPPPVYCVAVSRVTPKQLFVGRKTKLTIHLTKHGKEVSGVHVRITGPKINIRTKASNSKGVITRTITMKKAGILVFSPIASKRCNTQRVGVTNVFTPPVTG